LEIRCNENLVCINNLKSVTTLYIPCADFAKTLMVNPLYIQRYDFDNNVLQLTNSTVVKIARRRKKI